MIPIAEILNEIAAIMVILYEAVIYQFGVKSENRVIFYGLKSELTIAWIIGVNSSKTDASS